MNDDETIARLTVERDAARAALAETMAIIDDKWRHENVKPPADHVAWRAERLAEWRRARGGR